MLRRLLALGLCLFAAPALALVVLGPDDVHTHPPRKNADRPAFPYWNHVVSIGGYSAVYLGEGWVLTAGHVGVADVRIRGRRHRALRDSEIDLRTGFYSADLVLFRVTPDPGLPSLPIAVDRPAIGADALLLGWGRSGGDTVDWKGRLGRYWVESAPRLRWGSNQVSRVGVRSSTKAFHTETFASRFDPDSGQRTEAQAATGDSGGGVFLRRGNKWELAGILLMIQRHTGQPWNAALSGNQTFAADLSLYREQIEAITGLGSARRP